MDEIKVEKTPTSTHTTINRTEAAPSGSGSMIWFIVGGLLVAVIVVAYFVMGDGMPTTNASAPTGGDVSVNVETAPAPAAEATPETAPAETAPEPAPVVE